MYLWQVIVRGTSEKSDNGVNQKLREVHLAMSSNNGEKKEYEWVDGLGMSKIEFIARVRYLGWICFMMGSGQELHDVPEDYEISEERLSSLMQGTEWALKNPDATAEENHMNWCKAKVEQGYLYGKTLDTERKTHPSLVPFEDLDLTEQTKDKMDLLMVRLADKLYNMLDM